MTVDQSGEVNGPKLWSPETPKLYTAVSRVYVKGAVEDEFRTRFGIRWFTWTADDGLTFNGKHRYFHGADVHQDHAGWGDAVTNAGARRDVAMVKEAGFDFIRGSHYPHKPAFADACDELGVLFWSENDFWGIGGYKGDGYFNASSYPTKEEDQAPFEAHVLAEPGRDDPDQSQPSVDHRVEHVERAVLLAGRGDAQGAGAAGEGGCGEPRAGSDAAGGDWRSAARRDRPDRRCGRI